MKRTALTIEKSYEEVYDEFEKIRTREIRELMWAEKINPDFDECHEVLKFLSKELNFEYERKKRT